ncbi:excisionase family DNA-binding protein [Corynebacterium renale]|jgi:excisionase family DNA binding protein|uniref:excisionase family DNA-binding protein n=1 Tax=Corynebacterium renale TaxID=1724 RepID=UPI000E02AB5E|nr:excisionase family DNA-binding protein [Corynebacterium renale]STD04062.1 DNA binding domain-containing protein [Corynebacterium renale]
MSAPLVTLQEAVEEGYGAYSTLRMWIAQGKLPAYKTGSRIKVRREDLDALLTPVGPDPIDVAIDELVSAAPTLSSEQRSRLASLVGGA